MRSAAARATNSGMRTTLSCSENSVCNLRWTKGETAAGMAREFSNECVGNYACKRIQRLACCPFPAGRWKRVLVLEHEHVQVVIDAHRREAAPMQRTGAQRVQRGHVAGCAITLVT